MALFLVVLMSINNFGAVVSDNDGSAFITKAEFDSLKNDFQAQINQYNTSIDAKIDGAIASYLSGIKLSDATAMTENIDILTYPLKIVNRYKRLDDVDGYANPSASWVVPNILFNADIFDVHSNRNLYSFKSIDFSVGKSDVPFLNCNWVGDHLYANGVSKDMVWTYSAMVIGDVFDTRDSESGQITSIHYWWDLSVYKEKQDINLTGTNRESSGKIEMAPDGYWLGKLSTGTNTDWPIMKASPYFMKDTEPYYETFISGQSLNTMHTSQTRGTTRLNDYTPRYYKHNYTAQLNKNLDFIMNKSEVAAGMEDKTMLCGVTYGDNQEIWLTNKRRNRLAGNSNIRDHKIWNGRSILPETNSWYPKDKYNSYITAGYNIESPWTSITMHTDKTKMSAMPPSYIYYYITCSNIDKNRSVSHHMVDGLPILWIPNSYTNGLSQLKITLDISSEKTETMSNPKYIVFSTSPITMQQYSGSVSEKGSIAASDCLEFKNTNTVVDGTGNKLALLDEGNNTFTFDNVDTIHSNDIIYAKILFGGDEQWITINESPTFELTSAS